jgi:hypothetical protein
MNNKPIYNRVLESLKRAIDYKKNYVLLLEKRLVLLKKDLSLKSEYERNEIDIITYQTLSLISNANTFIKNKEKDFVVELIEFYADLEELDKNYKEVVEQAKKQQSNNIDLKHILYHTNWKYIEENIDEKISFYKNLKQQLV